MTSGRVSRPRRQGSLSGTTGTRPVEALAGLGVGSGLTGREGLVWSTWVGALELMIVSTCSNRHLSGDTPGQRDTGPIHGTSLTALRADLLAPHRTGRVRHPTSFAQGQAC